MTPDQDQLSRREALQTLISALAVAGLSTLVGTTPALAMGRKRKTPSCAGPYIGHKSQTTHPTRRLAIVGGGMGGLATAWFCDSGWTTDLFEAREKLGGHCDSETISYRGHPVTVDLGAQFFHPDTHPLYVSLLEELGLCGQLLEARGTLSIFPLDQPDPYFVSRQPLDYLSRAMDFASYTRAARRLITENGSYELTLEEWVRSLGS